jgi:hypothetical protein
MNERTTGRVVPVLRADGVQILVTIDIARNTDFLKKYGMRVLDESALTKTYEPFNEVIQDLPKRRPMLKQQVEETVAPLTTQEMMEQTPEVPDEDYVSEQDAEAEINQVTEETNQATKTRKK